MEIPKHFLKALPRITLACIICLLSVGYGCKSQQAEVREWRFALEEIKGGVQDAYATRFKELIEAKTQGAIQVSIYPYGTLGNSDQITELVNNGALHFAMASPGHLGKIIPEVQVFLLHFLFSDRDQVNREVYRQLQHIPIFDALYAEKGLNLLAFYPEGWMAWTTQKAIRSPADFKGVKLRVMTSALLLAAYQAYGASPVAMPYSEIYSALQLKMIDGQVNPVFAIEEMSFYEVTRYLIFPRQAQFITSAVASQSFFESLPPAEQQLIKETIAELNDYIYDLQIDYNQSRLETIQARSEIQLLELTAAERESFRKVYAPVYARYLELAGEAGPGILAQIQSLVEETERQLSPQASL